MLWGKGACPRVSWSIMSSTDFLLGSFQAWSDRGAGPTSGTGFFLTWDWVGGGPEVLARASNGVENSNNALRVGDSVRCCCL